MAYASFYGMGSNLHHAMSSQMGSIVAHGPPFSHLTDWARSPFVFLLKGSRVKTQGSHCFSCLFMEGFLIKLVHLVLFRYKKDWAFHISYITFFYSIFFLEHAHVTWHHVAFSIKWRSLASLFTGYVRYILDT